MTGRLLRDDKGVVLVMVLMALAVITALVTEFAYGVYASAVSLHNWRDSQRASLAASSGVTVAAGRIGEAVKFSSYTYPGREEVSVDKIFDGFEGVVVMTIEDENSRFNLNSLVRPNGDLNAGAYAGLKRLLRSLELDEEFAGRVADRIDKDGEPRAPEAESGAKNGYLDSVDEMFLLKGMDKSIYGKISPYVTVWGPDRIEGEAVNINTAPAIVIMSIDERITKELAERVVSYRELKPFENAGEISRVAGFEGALGASLMGRLTVKSSIFRIRASAAENGIKRIVEAVIEAKGGNPVVKFWMES